MKTVHEVSKLAGVSVRTLHHYDAIGLLKPTQVTPAGYRLYDDAALARLQTILLFRELRFSLKEIGTILDSPRFDRRQAMKQQMELLSLQRERLDKLIVLARELSEKGGDPMDFSAFDKTQLEQYAAEAKARWGDTEAYREYEHRGNDSVAILEVFREFGAVRHLPPDHPDVQAVVDKLRDCITQNYYTCTTPILAGLGQMYAADDRFQANIDAAGGPGTAQFAAQAIAYYCK